MVNTGRRPTRRDMAARFADGEVARQVEYFADGEGCGPGCRWHGPQPWPGSAERLLRHRGGQGDPPGDEPGRGEAGGGQEAADEEGVGALQGRSEPDADADRDPGGAAQWSAARWMPEAMPTSSSVTPVTATYCSLTVPSPIPAAMNTMAGIIARPVASKWETRAMAAIARTVEQIPARTQTRAPHCPSNPGTSAEATIRNTAKGSVVSPARSPTGP